MSNPVDEEDLKRDVRAALQAVESVLARKGDVALAKVSDEFSLAMRAMVDLRNRLTQERRAGCSMPDAVSLDQVNALISVMAGIEYPLAGIHWPRIQQVSESLKKMAAA